MTRIAVWYGPEAELYELQKAVNHNCTCINSKQVCAAHKMLTSQETLDHLAYVCTQKMRFIQAEFDPKAEFGL